MKQEPVAWMLLGLEDQKPKLINLQVIEHLEGTWTPLYTAPRELSDEEIINEWIDSDRNYYNFARAILDKQFHIVK